MKRCGEDNHILSISINQTYDCLLCTTMDGFIVYHINPFQTMITRFIDGGIRLGAMFHKSNIFVLCGTGTNKKFPINRAVLWNDEKKAPHAEISISNKIEKIEITQEEILVIKTINNLFIYDIQSLEQLSSFPTHYDQLDYNLYRSSHSLVFTKGGLPNQGMIYMIRNQNGGKKITENRCFKAHDNGIVQLAISKKKGPTTHYIASCSIKSKSIRIFEMETFAHCFTLHRGLFYNPICCLTFSSENDWLLCSTQTGTLHLFSLRKEDSLFGDSWLPQYRRHTSKYDISEPLKYIYCDDSTGNWCGYSKTTLYTGRIVNNANITLEKQFLLAIKKDPFSSPKRHKKISSHI